MYTTARQREEGDSTNRGDHDRRQVEAIVAAKPQQAREKEAADERADDADDQVREKPVVAAGDPFGKPRQPVECPTST